MTRADGRADDELRQVTITRNWLDHAAGSVLVEFGKTRVLCAASAAEGVPRWRKGSGLGWVTAEYAMLPASTNTRSDRESVKGRIGGRTHEISRLVGRSLRAVIDYQAMGENTIQLDCDVLQADGGTRTAAITGAYVALADAVSHLRSTGALTGEPLTGSVAAISVGIIDGVPRWRKGSGLGWVTAEYAMLPASTNTRSDRESVKGRIGGRTHEISRLIGRSLRAVIDYRALGENTIQLDCDVLQADGGTRTAAITGAYVALADAVSHLRSTGALTGEPLTGSVAAISVGIIDGVPRLDLPYVEDVRAETDMNIVMTGQGSFVEVQGTAEGAAFSRAELDALLALGEKGCADLTRLQQEALAGAGR